ncbi:MAG: class I SAM-dependent methyltransferase [Pseudomonadota bacterium]
MTTTESLQKEQSDYWNGEMGETWATGQDFFDEMLQPFEALLVEEVEQLAPQSVLDVGCGNGSTTLAIKRNLPQQAVCTGIDISKPMLANARRRAVEQDLDVQFILADAAAHTFGDDAYDVIASRFGVMFFSDPVAAFANLRHAAAHSASLRLIVWRSPEENEFMTAAARAAAPFLPDASPPDPAAPGPFAFGDADRVRSYLEQSGWGEVDLVPHDVLCAFPEAHLDLFFTKVARLRHDLDQLSDDVRSEVQQAVRKAYEPYTSDNEVRFTGRCWVIRARTL